MATSSSSLPASRRSSASRVGGLAAAAAGPPPPRSKSTVSFGELGGSGGGAIKRRSTQDHIDQILETGRSRADNMGTGTGVSEGSNPAAAARPRSRPAISEDGEPNETTGIAAAGGQHHNHGTFNGTRRRKIPTADSPNQNGVEAEQRPHDEEVKDEKSWLAEYLSGLWTIELENTGSTARDHLALERTFLAWLRTSLGFASIGIAITQLFRLNTSLASGQSNDPHLATIRHIGKPLGATFIGISILVLLLGYMRYYQSQQWVMKGKFPASRGAIILVSLISFALMAVSLTVVIVVQPTTVRAQ